MALQLLKRNYTMGGREVPKILKVPQGEMRWAPRRLPVDVGDVMMNVRMDDSKNKYINEHVSKYAQGVNPYGEWGYPYKVNKNNIRPPIIDPKYYAPLSRMPVKFDSITAGPIVKNLYEKQVEIDKIAPKTIIDKLCVDAGSNVSARGDSQKNNTYREGNIDMHLKLPRPSIPYHPSMPYQPNTGVPQVELDPMMITRAQAGIHAPFNISDQSRDVMNMRTPMHVAVRPGYKTPYTSVNVTPEEVAGINNSLQTVGVGTGQKATFMHNPEINNEVTLVPKVQSSAFYNPSYYLTNLSGYNIGNTDMECNLTTPLHVSQQTNARSQLRRDGKLGEVHLQDSLNLGHFDGKSTIPTIQRHAMQNMQHSTTPDTEYFSVQPMRSDMAAHPSTQRLHYTGKNEANSRMRMQVPQVQKNYLGTDRINPVNPNRRFVRG